MSFASTHTKLSIIVNSESIFLIVVTFFIELMVVLFGVRTNLIKRKSADPSISVNRPSTASIT